MEKAALGLSGANLTVVNGAEGLSQVATGLVAQGLAIFDALRDGHAAHREGNAASPFSANGGYDAGLDKTGLPAR